MGPRLLVIAAALAAGCAASPPADLSTYAGQESRDIKSLSAEEVQGLLAGKGLGYAKPAELNGYPGPFHVLEMADKLELTNRAADAVSLGASLARIGDLLAKVRAAHLEAHLSQAAILTPEQVEKYVRLRGYAAGSHSHSH